MKSNRAILSLQVTKVSGSAARAISGFLDYIENRDHPEVRPRSGLVGLVDYVTYRDKTSPHGRLFDSTGPAGAAERRQLVRHVRRSLAAQPESARTGRAVYRMVLSPEDARGLDLRRLARGTMEQLERDLGGKLPAWIAAEHRNTAHPHVHIVMAARREVEPGRFREVRITKPRLARMKVALAFELESQRGARQPYRSLEERLLSAATPRARKQRGPGQSPRVVHHGRSGFERLLFRIAARSRRESQRLERQLEEQRESENGGAR